MKKEALIGFYQTYRMFIFPAVVALSSLFLIIFAIYPQTVKLINNQKVTGEVLKKTEVLEDKAVALESYNEEDLAMKLALALKALPEDKDYGGMLSLLQQLVSQSGFSITSMSLGNTSSKLGNADSFDVRLEVSGLKSLFQALLDNFENSPRIVRIKSIDISSADSSFKAVLEVGVLYSKQSQSAGTLDSPLPELSQKDEDVIAALTKNSSMLSVIPVVPSSPKGKVNPFE